MSKLIAKVLLFIILGITTLWFLRKNMFEDNLGVSLLIDNVDGYIYPIVSEKVIDAKLVSTKILLGKEVAENLVIYIIVTNLIFYGIVVTIVTGLFRIAFDD